MKLFSFCTFALLLAQSSTSAAYEYSLTGGNTETSNQFHVAELHLRGEASNNGFGLAVGEANGGAGDTNFNLVNVEGLYTYKTKTWVYQAEAGMYDRTISTQPAAQYAVGDLTITKNFTEFTNLQLQGGQGYFGQDLQTQYSIENGMTGAFYKLSGTLRWDKRWRSDFYARQIFLDDANTRSDQDLDLMYGISPDWPWIWVGFGANNLTDTRTDQPYWSPRQFIDYGPRVDISFPLWSDKWAFATGFNLNKFRDIDAGEGIGYYATAKVVYQPTEKFRMELGYEGIKSEQYSNVWRSDAGMLTLIWKP